MISKEVKRARITAIVFGTLSSLTLIAFVFAFIQHELAKANEVRAEQQTRIANEYAERSIECERMAREMQMQTVQQIKECQRKNDELEQELIKLRNGRTK